METMISPPERDFLIRCPRLGHQIYFEYCRSENMGLPCFKILDCWFEHFPVEEFLRKELKPEEWDRFSNRPSSSKVQSLMDLIEEAKKRKAQQSAGLILAAGASERMGDTKQLLKLGDHTLLEHTLKEALRSDLNHIVLVLGHKAAEIRKKTCIEPDEKRLKIIENDNWKEGISSSIIAGLSEVKSKFDHCMIILADMPFITSHLINKLLHDYLSSGLPIGAIRMGERRSHPVIFNRSMYKELNSLKGDTGGREIFVRYQDDVFLVEPVEGYIDMDIDTPGDYNAYLDSLNKK